MEPHEKKRRQKRDKQKARRIDLYPEMQYCPVCGAKLEQSYRSERYVETLEEFFHVVSHACHCPVPGCSFHPGHLRPEAEDLLALQGYLFGLDVVARIGELRFAHEQTIPKIHQILHADYKLSISQREVGLLADVYLALVTTVAKHDAELLEQLKRQPGLILSIDGVQPEKGNETLYLIRDLISGRVLVAENLKSSATGDIEKLLNHVIELQLPILGVISDKQDAIVAAVRNTLPAVPHQICQYHYLKDVSAPVVEADRKMKKEIKQKVRGVRAVERALEGEEGVTYGQEDRQVVGEYCLAIRTIITEDGQYPLESPGVSLYEKLSAIRESIERCVQRRSHPLLEQLLVGLSVLMVCAPEYQRLKQGFEWIRQIAHRLGNPSDSRRGWAFRRLEEWLAKTKATQEHLDPWQQEILSHFEKVTESFGVGLFEYLRQPWLPRANNDLEVFIGRTKKSRRKITGRKNTTAFILREGRFVAILFGLPKEFLSIARLSAVPRDAFREHLVALREGRDQKKRWQIRHHFLEYLKVLETQWQPILLKKAS